MSVVVDPNEVLRWFIGIEIDRAVRCDVAESSHGVLLAQDRVRAYAVRAGVA